MRATLSRSPELRTTPRARRRRLQAPVIAVDLGGTKIVAARIDARGRIGRRLVQPVDTTSFTAPIDQIVSLVRHLDDGGTTVRAAGVAIPGLVRQDGTVWAPNLPGWKRVPLAQVLRRRLRMPVLVESDRNASVLGEAWRGAARGKQDVVVLMVGTGIGAGILSGGRLVRGAHELSGCAGWMVVTEHANDATARIGSLESHAAGPAVARSARMTTAVDAASAARAGDEEARGAFVVAGRLLGAAVANIISLLDPEVIVLTGGLSAASDLFLRDLIAAARSAAQPLAARQVAIVPSRLGSDANLLGAARLALSDLEGSLDER